MSRWMIEKDGTGIGKSGTGIEKSGTGIEKSGTGIERAGTGIEKSGTGIRRMVVACSLAAMTFASGLHADTQNPAGSLQLVVNPTSIAVSWIIDGSVFSGVAPLGGSFATLMLTEIALSSDQIDVEVTGNGTGASTQVTGNGTGSSTQVTGNGTGSSTQVTGNGTGSSTQVTGNGTGLTVQVTGNGTGSSTQVTGNGTGSSTLVTGNGTGSSTLVTGNGTGSSTEVTGNGTGSTIQVTGNGTGTEAITITLPNGTGLAMEVSLDCNFASVTVLDSSTAPVVAFDRVPIIGDAGLCSGGVNGVNRGWGSALGN